MKIISISICLLCIMVSLMGIGLKGERYATDGIEYYQHGDYHNAILMFKAADEAAQGSKPEYFYWLGRLHIALADTSKAKYWLKRYIDSHDTANLTQVQDYLEIINRQTLIFESITMREMPSYINSRNSDYGAVASPKGNYLYFNSLRPAPYGKENIWRAERLNTLWGNPELVTELCTDKNEAIGSFSANGDIAYLSGNYEKGKIDGDIYSSKHNGSWQKPLDLKDVNSDQVDVHPSVYNDNLLFFTSSRKGGFGGTDIYVSIKDGDTWQTPINLGSAINSSDNEQTPFLDWDGKTLFFASSGHVGFGGYDIFKSVKVGNSWTEWSVPENLGLPINSINDERYYYHLKNTNEAFISSNRGVDGFENMFALNLVYAPREFQIADSTGTKITVFDEDKTSPISGKVEEIDLSSKPIVFSGQLTDEDGSPVSADIQFNYDRNGNQFRDITASNDNGDFQITVPRAEKYTVVINDDGYFLYSQEITPAPTDTTFSLNITLKKMEAKKVFVFDNIQFKFNSSMLVQEYNPVINEIVLTLLNNPDIKVEISGHTCNMGKASYNMWLSERRAKRVMDYLIAKGVDPSRLTSIGFGLTKPLNDNSTNALRIKNRRVEIKVMD